ncbi:carbohydrate deacetylase isoform X4 [Monodelphis domestica]|uniref:carbohydrate deacetylase isoform X4 n=1 Tax=Monodelphis domestica TaxID=13616 RepID=UPI0004435A0C|nr:carbohydrate deacetylase isoform X4 [Monodelphis domestica]
MLPGILARGDAAVSSGSSVCSPPFPAARSFSGLGRRRGLLGPPGPGWPRPPSRPRPRKAVSCSARAPAGSQLCAVPDHERAARAARRHRGRLRLLPAARPGHGGSLRGGGAQRGLPPGQRRRRELGGPAGPQAPHPRRPPRQPERGEAGEPERRLRGLLAGPQRLLLGQDGLPRGPGGRPGVRQVFAEVLREYGVRYTRVPVERGLHRCEWLEPQLQTFAVALEKDALAAREEFQELGLRCPDAFIGLSTMGKDMSVSRIEAAIDQAVESIQIPEDALKGGRAITLELMAHPGYPSVSPVGGCGEGPDDFSQSWERLHELQTLLDPTLHNFYRQRGIKLCAFEDL